MISFAACSSSRETVSMGLLGAGQYDAAGAMDAYWLIDTAGKASITPSG